MPYSLWDRSEYWAHHLEALEDSTLRPTIRKKGINKENTHYCKGHKSCGTIENIEKKCLLILAHFPKIYMPLKLKLSGNFNEKCFSKDKYVRNTLFWKSGKQDKL